MTTMTTTDSTIIKPERRTFDKPKIPYREQIRAFRLVAGDRELVLDKRTIAFACQEIKEPATHTVIGLKVRGAAPIVVCAPCDEVLDWWLGKDRPPTPPPAPKGEAPATNGKAAP
jgi:hypothetical protein